MAKTDCTISSQDHGTATVNAMGYDDGWRSAWIRYNERHPHDQMSYHSARRAGMSAHRKIAKALGLSDQQLAAALLSVGSGDVGLNT